MSLSDTEQLILKEIQNHYAKSSAPYYLAQLGKFFRDKEITLPSNVKLKDYIKTRFHERLYVIEHPKIAEKVAVTTQENFDQVNSEFNREFSPISKHTGIKFDKIPFALLAAFCKEPQDGQRIFFSTTPPFRYQVASKAPDDTYVEIEKDFQPSHLKGCDIHRITSSEREDIYKHILRWANDKRIDLRTLYYDSGFSSSDMEFDQYKTSTCNALDRLIEIQDPKLRDKFLIPADIAKLLMRAR